MVLLVGNHFQAIQSRDAAMLKPMIAATPGGGLRPDPTKPIVIRRKAIAGWKAIGAAVFFAGLGYLLWSTAVPTHPIAAYVYGGMLIAGALFGFWQGIGVAIRRPVALLIASEGITVLGKRSPDLIRWSDLRGAHTATIGSGGRDEIVALQLVDPQSFYARLESDRRGWYWRSSRVRPNCYPIFSSGLDIPRLQLLKLFEDGIRRWGTADPDLRPQTSYWTFSNWSPVPVLLIVVGVMVAIALLAAPFALLRPPRWIQAADNCDVSNPYKGKQWRSMRAVWTGPCVDGRAEGDGTLEWFRNGERTMRYSGRMEGGRITGRGERAEYGMRYDGLWKDGILQEGTATFPDGRQYRGTWNQGYWATGVLTMPGGWQWDGQWYGGRLTGEGSAKARQGEFKGNWTDGVPQGAGVFVTRDGRRFEGTWEDGKPVDPEMARLQEQERWDCLWTVLPGRYDTPIRTEPWGCRIR